MSKYEKSNLEILQEIRQMRLNELAENGEKDVSIPMVQYIGQGAKSKQKLFRLTEVRTVSEKERDEENGEYVESGEHKEYSERFYVCDGNDIHLVALRNEQTNGEVLPMSPELDTLKDEIEQCLEERDKMLRKVAKEMGLSPEEIDNLSEIDLEQKVLDAQEKGLDKDKEEKKTGEETKLTEEQASSLDALNELNTSTQVDSRGTTIGKALNLDELGYTKILVVHAHKLQEVNAQRENIKFGLVGVRADGTMEAISTDKIRMYRGSNDEIVNIKNPQEVDINSNGYAFEIVGTNRRLVINQTDSQGRPEVYLSHASRDNDGNVAQMLPDKYKGTERSDVEVRDLYNGYHGEDQIENSYNEAMKHKEAGCDDIDIDEVDGDDTTGHQHLEDGTVIVGVDVNRIEVIEEISEKCKVSLETAEEYYNKIVNDEQQGDDDDSEGLTKEEIVDKAQDIAEQELGAQARTRGF